MSSYLRFSSSPSQSLLTVGSQTLPLAGSSTGFHSLASYSTVLKENYASEYENYLTKIKDTNKIDWYGGGDIPNALTQPVVSCVLDNTTDYIKSSSGSSTFYPRITRENGLIHYMVVSSAQVLLGVTPTILAVLGASASELSMVSVVAQRPFLSLLLALGSPSVFVSRAFEYSDPVELLRDRKGRLRPSHLRRRWSRRLVATAQYTAALAAVANVAELGWELGVKTVCSFWPDNVIAPILWGLLVIPAHVGGGVVLRLQIRRTGRTTLGSVEKTGPGKWLGESWGRAWAIWGTEFRPAASQGNVFITAFRERRLLVVLSWLLSICVIAHVIYGTLVLSSLYFIGTRDALYVVGRYMTSVLACRIIVMYEIAGLRERCQWPIVLKYDEPEDREKHDPWDDSPMPVLVVSNSVVS